jgi:PAS domain S-box-containing protein
MDFDLVFVDIILEGKSGLDLLKNAQEHAHTADFIIITGAPSVETAANSVRLGALDYVVKPIRHGALMRITERALSHRALRKAEENYRLNLEAIFRSVRDAIITVDDQMTVVEVNPAAEAICGIRRSGVAGMQLEDIEMECSSHCLGALRDTVAGRERIDIPCVECASLDDPGQIVSITATPLLRPDGSASGGVMVIRNETRLVELERCVAETRQLGKIIGSSTAIQGVFRMIEALADVRTSVLITGESGTGKELVADALHAAGSRCDQNLVKVNCAALSEGLLESELFGHVRGAFTGAVKDKIGRFQRADYGSIFLDEIGEMTPGMQLRLLRVLETMEFERVGDSKPIKVDVRVIAATNRDLEQKVKAGQFREDLFFRLKVVEIKLPPLRQRRDDIPLLVQHFLDKFNDKFSKQVSKSAASRSRLWTSSRATTGPATSASSRTPSSTPSSSAAATSLPAASCPRTSCPAQPRFRACMKPTATPRSGPSARRSSRLSSTRPRPRACSASAAGRFTASSSGTRSSADRHPLLPRRARNPSCAMTQCVPPRAAP